MRLRPLDADICGGYASKSPCGQCALRSVLNGGRVDRLIYSAPSYDRDLEYTANNNATTYLTQGSYNIVCKGVINSRTLNSGRDRYNV